MNRLILFTPIGGTDPISLNNGYDGAFIHICRVYKPTDVVLYMSAEIYDLHKNDDRYCYCLKRLCEHIDHNIEPHIIERKELVNVYEFDWFYRDFRKIFHEIFGCMDETDRLLVNISSGTPAMKSGLCVLATMGEYPVRLLQVFTPVKGMNDHTHEKMYTKEFLELLWEADPDNEENFENRCREIKCPNLSLVKNEEILKKYINEYDYYAAVKMAEAMPQDSVSGYISLLKIAQARKQLDMSETDRLSLHNGVNFIPVKDTDKRKYMEYALALDLKRKCGEYADFLRALTPLIADLLELVLKEQFGIDIDTFCINTNGVRKWNPERLRTTDNATASATGIESILNNEYNGRFNGGPVSSAHLMVILSAQDCSGNDSLQNLKDIFSELRGVEAHIRNLAAHEIMCITDDEIKKRTGFTSEQIMNKIKSVFPYAGIKARRSDWDSYEEMNAEIIRCIEDQAWI